MKVTRWTNLVLITVLLAACGPGGISLPGVASPTPSSPLVGITPAPSTEAAASAFLDSWQNDDYPAMYAMLTRASREAISEEDFVTRYADIAATMSLQTLSYEILSTLTNPSTAQTAFRVTYETKLVGVLQRDMLMQFELEGGQWHITWSPELILPELAGGNRLVMDYRIPARGDIYDRKGQPVVTWSSAVALGIVPGQINPDSESFLLSELSRLTSLSPGTIQAFYQFAQPDWYVPVGETTAEEFNNRLGVLSGLGGLAWTEYQARFYHNGGIAPQSVGYMLSISPEQLVEYRRLGYRGDERVGASGVEKWAEDFLAGKHGGSLYVVSPEGQIVTRLAASDPEPAQTIYLTIDRTYQQQVQAALAGFRGAAVVLERDTGRILALVSSPGFDPNLFEPANRNNMLLSSLLNDGNRPLFNRATQGTYPLGSVFKIVTMAAALESDSYTPLSTYDCQYSFTELIGITLYDWTWERCQRELRETGECRTQPSGLLTLPEGLMRSCNPWFYHIGLALYNQDQATAIAEMSRAFGLGRATGLEQVPEASGQIVDPPSPLDATNQAIGQGDNLVTPLQVAAFVAAVGNGGTLYRPQFVERIQPIEGAPTLVFEPQATGELPLSPENLRVIQDAMKAVVDNPRGTANLRLRGLIFRVAGKTGTAESGSGLPHSWFVGYTYAEIEGVPDIAIAVLIENVGEGSDFAAPVFRRLVELYFLGRAERLYPWESSFGVTRTPTPEGFELTPEP
jgi:penicillin-binding protein 2